MTGKKAPLRKARASGGGFHLPKIDVNRHDGMGCCRRIDVRSTPDSAQVYYNHREFQALSEL
jgi:hypothetical protein